MENVTDALKMAAAILIFVGALSLSIWVLTRARQASEAQITTSDTLVYTYDSSSSFNSSNFTSTRIVGIDEVIPNIYSYYSNYNTILFYTGSYNERSNTVSNIQPLELYETDAMDYSRNGSTTALDKSILKIGGGHDRKIYGLDINDERAREEPWAIDQKKYKLFLDSLVNNVDPDKPEGKNGVAVQWYNWSRNRTWDGSNWVELTSNNKIDSATHKIAMRFRYANIIGGSFADKNDAKFVERVGRYNYKVMQDSSNDKSGTTTYGGAETASSSTGGLLSSSSSATITFDNNETIDNQKSNETQKMVIQYIYIGG